MHAPDSRPSAAPLHSVARAFSGADPALWHLPLLLVIGAAYHFQYTQSGLNLMDEGWVLSAGRALHNGWTMYDDLFWVFPPGHALAGWIGWAIDPPGHVVARWIYAGFELALVATLYFLGRTFMPAGFSLLGALLLVTAAPDSHGAQFLFGYRYLVWTALALLCFERRLATGRRAWLLWAGVLVGVAVCFRTTPAFAAGCAIGFGVIFATRDWRVWLRDWTWFGGGILLVLVPVLAYFAMGVGLGAVWENVFVRAVVMTAKQAKPLPDLVWPDAFTVRQPVKVWFSAFQFRLHPTLYLSYALALGALYVRALRARRPFPHAVLLAVVIWGGLFFLRSLGRSDWGHLESALPPFCLLLAHASFVGLRALPLGPGGPRATAELAFGAALLAGWVYLQGSDLPFRPANSLVAMRAAEPNVRVAAKAAQRLDSRIREIRKWAPPGQIILDLSASPGFYALADRDGPGYLDLVMPGTFLDEADELEFIRRLERNPPRVIIWPSKPFDRSKLRGLEWTAPHLRVWVHNRYQRRGRDDGIRVLMVPLSEVDRTRRFNQGAR